MGGAWINCRRVNDVTKIRVFHLKNQEQKVYFFYFFL